MEETAMLCVLLFAQDVHDLKRFPPKEICLHNLTLANEQSGRVWEELKLYGFGRGAWGEDIHDYLIGGGMRGQYLLTLHRDLRKRAKFWEEMCYVTDPSTEITSRLTYRGYAEATLGRVRFAIGDWPAPVPLEIIPRGN